MGRGPLWNGHAAPKFHRWSKIIFSKKWRLIIIESGEVNVLIGNMDETLKVNQEHVVRSRSKPGCTRHIISVNAEAANQLVFFEQWKKLASLKSHFIAPESRTFATAISKLASAPHRSPVTRFSSVGWS